MKAAKRKRRSFVCSCARCLGVKTADPTYGFDRAAVSKVLCLHCDAAIGRRRWVPVPILHRHGQMMFRHAVCP